MSGSARGRYGAVGAPPRHALHLPILCDPDPALIVPRSDGTIAPDGGPLTTTGYRRIRQWQQEWQALPRLVIPPLAGGERPGEIPPARTSWRVAPIGAVRAPRPPVPAPAGARGGP